jgi:isopentenyl-diphosphate delta-isomerase
MGVVAGLSPLFTTQYRARVSDQFIENEFVHVFGGTTNYTPSLNASEVADWCWKTPAEIGQDVRVQPQTYTVWFRKFLDEFDQEIARFASA